MTHEDFISLLKKPELVNDQHAYDLKELVEHFPYFAPARLFYIKLLQQSNNIQFASNLKKASLFCSNRRWLYYYLYPEKLLSEEPYIRDRGNEKSSGDYFDMINAVESEGGSDTKQSLKNLAERLKLARGVVSLPTVVVHKKTIEIERQIEIKPEITPKIIIPKIVSEPKKDDTLEIRAKKLISEHKYREAIEILRLLNLNNPKKSVYFADQIRFLEKVIANSKK
jgi:hypothetical protein